MEIDNETSLYVSTDDNFKEIWKEFLVRFEKERYFIQPKGDLFEHYLDQIMNRDDSMFIDESTVFYRARINQKKEEMKDKDLEAPSADIASSGRLNAKNIQVLYMAYEETTAVSETRPYMGARVAIAECKPNKSLRILDLTRRLLGKKENDFRKLLSELFSKPYGPQESEKNYMPTQYLAEYIKRSGYDGVKYLSALEESGNNICIFEAENISVKYKKEVKVSKISVITE